MQMTDLNRIENHMVLGREPEGIEYPSVDIEETLDWMAYKLDRDGCTDFLVNAFCELLETEIPYQWRAHINYFLDDDRHCDLSDPEFWDEFYRFTDPHGDAPKELIAEIRHRAEVQWAESAREAKFQDEQERRLYK